VKQWEKDKFVKSGKKTFGEKEGDCKMEFTREQLSQMRTKAREMGFVVEHISEQSFTAELRPKGKLTHISVDVSIFWRPEPEISINMAASGSLSISETEENIENYKKAVKFADYIATHIV
jgi:hypothetical protein